MAHILVAAEICALKSTLGCNHLGILVGIEFVGHAVPKKFLALESQSVDIAQAYPATQFP